MDGQPLGRREFLEAIAGGVAAVAPINLANPMTLLAQNTQGGSDLVNSVLTVYRELHSRGSIRLSAQCRYVASECIYIEDRNLLPRGASIQVDRESGDDLYSLNIHTDLSPEEKQRIGFNHPVDMSGRDMRIFVRKQGNVLFPYKIMETSILGYFPPESPSGDMSVTTIILEENSFN